MPELRRERRGAAAAGGSAARSCGQSCRPRVRHSIGRRAFCTQPGAPSACAVRRQPAAARDLPGADSFLTHLTYPCVGCEDVLLTVSLICDSIVKLACSKPPHFEARIGLMTNSPSWNVVQQCRVLKHVTILSAVEVTGGSRLAECLCTRGI